ncbi:MAG: undecaprenyl-phosphate glucose phosphotransferase [Geminicoccaceae bacterium]
MPASRGVAAAWARGHLTNRIVLVGAGPQAVHLLQHVRRGDPALRILGIFDERRTRLPPDIEGCPVLGDLDALVGFVRRERVDQVIITLPQSAATRRLACLEQLRSLPVHVRLCPDLPALETSPRGITDLAGLPLLRIYDRPLAGWAGLIKRLEDRLLAGVLLVLLAPLMLLTALAIRLESRGPALYRQERYGFDNRPIRVLKFRTMFVERCDPPDGAVTPARRGDPRVTGLGRILRSTSIDELPQLINVLRGEMSLVGPRPHASRQNEQFANLIDGYLARHRVKPGITGWAQVHGLRGEVDTLAKMQERVRYDLFYIENWSLQLDLRIILRTFLVGFSHPNAY